ncbi:unnamed protein product [Heterobilharzia americana]|nr:unnamed protein product [Heterobilharzia americana]
MSTTIDCVYSMDRMNNLTFIRKTPYKTIIIILTTLILILFIKRNNFQNNKKLAKTVKIYSTFDDLKRDFLRGRLKLNTSKVKEIVIYGNMMVPVNTRLNDCLITNCVLHTIKSRFNYAQMIIITGRKFPDVKYNKNQVWIAYHHEAPPNSRLSKSLGDRINFTATYRLDSTIRVPYGAFVPLPPIPEYYANPPLKPRDVASRKRKTVAWVVSNCYAKSPRNLYAYELSKHIQVDIYGRCTQRKCTRFNCFQMLKEDYKFYLSFENSLCQDYITEKFFDNALKNDVIPVVMGASLEEYQRVAPPNSFIHVDQFNSPKDLASYLNYLDKNQTAFNEYFIWQQKGSVYQFPGKPECDFCLLANALPILKQSWYPDLQLWLNNGCQGRKLRWKGHEANFSAYEWFRNLTHMSITNKHII